jgi:chitin disaccharide deacetylase
VTVSRRLIVTADDVGLDSGMTAGAIRAHREGIVTACSVVANGRAFEDAIARLRDVPSLEVGVHLALVEEVALTTGAPMARNYLEFLLVRRGVNVERELRAQIERVLATGLRVTHLNGHQHLHGLPALFRLVLRLAREYRIGYVRAPRDAGGRAGAGRRMAVRALAMLTPRGGTNDRAIGIAEAGHLTADRIIALLGCVDGITELVAHPGIGVGSYAHWRYAWEAETVALCDPRVRAAVAERGIALLAPSAVSASESAR